MKKETLGKPRRRQDGNIKMGLGEVGCGVIDWIDLAQDMEEWQALVNTVMNLWVPQSAVKLLSRCTTPGFSRRAQLHGVRQPVKQTYVEVLKNDLTGPTSLTLQCHIRA